MKTIASINLSESVYSSTYFENLQNNPSKYFLDLRIKYVQKEIKRFDGLESFSKEIILVKAAKENRLNVEISQRKGYKSITFTA
jgi:hypothetical protein